MVGSGPVNFREPPPQGRKPLHLRGDSILHRGDGAFSSMVPRAEKIIVPVGTERPKGKAPLFEKLTNGDRDVPGKSFEKPQFEKPY